MRLPSLEDLLYLVPGILLTVTLHELAHGWVSYKFGDPTPKEDGRLSVNPLRHLDLCGTLALLLVGFGWAKPVQVDPSYYKDPRTGIVWTAFAGPLINFILAFLLILLDVLLLRFILPLVGISDLTYYFHNLLQITALLSLGQAIFNLIPLPPLDGSKILYGLLPDEWYFKIMRYEPVLSLLLFLLLFSGIFNMPLLQLRSAVYNGMAGVWMMLFGIG